MLTRMLQHFEDLSQSLDGLDGNTAKRIVEAAVSSVMKTFRGSYICDVLWKDRAGDAIVLRPVVTEQHAATARRRPGNYVLEPQTSQGVWAHVFFCGKPVWAVGIRQSMQDHQPIKDEASGAQIPPDSRAYAFFAETDTIIVHPLAYREIVWGIFSLEFRNAFAFQQDVMWQITRLTGCIAGTLWKHDIQRINAEDTRAAVNRFAGYLTQAVPTVPLTPYPSCFVARPFEPPFNAVQQCLSRILGGQGVAAAAYQAAAPETRPIVDDIIAHIQAAHFCIADLTGANPNVLLEVGMMFSHGKPLILLQSHDDATAPPFNVATYPFHKYRIRGGQMEVLSPSTGQFELFEPKLMEYAHGYVTH